MTRITPPDGQHAVSQHQHAHGAYGSSRPSSLSCGAPARAARLAPRPSLSKQTTGKWALLVLVEDVTWKITGSPPLPVHHYKQRAKVGARHSQLNQRVRCVCLYGPSEINRAPHHNHHHNHHHRHSCAFTNQTKERYILCFCSEAGPSSADSLGAWRAHARVCVRERLRLFEMANVPTVQVKYLVCI